VVVATLLIRIIMDTKTIRPSTLTAFGPDWQQPTGDEVRAIIDLCGFSDSRAASVCGVHGDRTVRKWKAWDEIKWQEAKDAGRKVPSMQRIPFAAWAIFAEQAGFGCLWKK
jgi:hypothetical protein